MNLGLRGHSKTPEDIAMGLTEHYKALRDSFKMQLEEFKYKDIMFNSPTQPTEQGKSGTWVLSALCSISRKRPAHSLHPATFC